MGTVAAVNAKRLHPKARIILLLNALYNVAESLCSVFVGVYFYVNSLDYRVVCYHYLALYIVTPCVFMLAGWYSQARDRVHVYRLGLMLHAVYYATLLWLREDSADYAVPLGVLLGVTWGFFWAGSNTFDFDVTTPREREYYFGWLGAVSGTARLTAPLLSAFIIHLAPTNFLGYHVIFSVALLIYLAALGFSLLVPHDRKRRPFRIRRALFPGRDQWDWRWVMLASVSQAGVYSIFYFLLGLVMYMQTGSELSVGGFAALQACIAIAMAYFVGRKITAKTYLRAMRIGTVILLVAGVLILFRLSVFTLILFGLLRSIAHPLFGIPHSSIRLDVIEQSAENPSQRIEYLCAWEVPLALGRVIMIGGLILLAGYFDEMALRIVLFLLCANRLLTYFFISRISFVREAQEDA